MRALDPEVVDAVFAAIEPLLPVPTDDHPLGFYNPRIDDRVCFEGILTRLVVGCSWETAEQLMRHAVWDTTLRTRNNTWVEAGIFDHLADEAIAAYDRIIELDLSECSIDGSQPVASPRASASRKVVRPRDHDLRQLRTTRPPESIRRRLSVQRRAQPTSPTRVREPRRPTRR
jgi:transposase